MEDVNRQQSYRRWLYKIEKKHLYEWVVGISCGIKEYEFDINGDGRKELIVWGVETERDEMRTAIFGRCQGKVYRVIQYSENYEQVISVKKRCIQNLEGRKLRISQSDYRKELEKYNFQKSK